MADVNKLVSLKLSLGFSDFISSPNNKIVILCSSGFHVMTLSFTDQFLHLLVSHDDFIPTFPMTFVYAKCIHQEHLPLWDDLLHLQSTISSHPWLLAMDFNTIASLDEYVGCAVQDLCSIDDFTSFTTACALTDLPVSGGLYTWTGVRPGERVWKRLDRMLVNEHWISLFSSSLVQHLNRASSDHSPLLLSFGEQ